MLVKVKLRIEDKSQMFLSRCRLSFFIIKNQGSWGPLSRLCEKQTSVACLVGSGLDSISHRYTHRLISLKSLLGLISDFFLAIAIKNSDLSSANILQSEVNPPGKSFIYVTNNNGPKTDPCGTRAKMFSREDVCQFKRTRCCRSLR